MKLGIKFGFSSFFSPHNQWVHCGLSYGNLVSDTCMWLLNDAGI